LRGPRWGLPGGSTVVDELLDRIAGRSGRIECRCRVRAFALGCWTDLPRLTCWTIVEHPVAAPADGMQHLQARAVWDTKGVGADLRDYVVQTWVIPGAVLVIEETRDVKKRHRTVGMKRQYAGTAGRIENAQIASG
jgi:hypothetical protein